MAIGGNPFVITAERTRRVAGAAVLLCFSVSAGLVRAQPAAGGPIKLALKSTAAVFRVGDQPVLEVSALDASGNPSPVWRDFPVDVLLEADTGTLLKVAHTLLKKGNAAIEVALPPQGQPGLHYVEATNPRLFPGGTYLDVRAPRGAAPEAAPGRPAAPAIALRFSPRREFLADGADAATIRAFLLDSDAASPEYRIDIVESGGTLRSRSLVIPRGETRAETTLTSDKSGEITVQFVGVKPSAAHDGAGPLKIRFSPPVTQLTVKASLTEISLFDTPELTVEVLDRTGRPVILDAPRKVSLELVTGRGRLEQADLEIAAGSSSARTALHPTWFGELVLLVHTPNLASERVFLPVLAPLQQLSLALFSGIVGGSLALVTRRGMPLWRVLMGSLTGFIFYWGCLYAGLPTFSRTVLLHPATAVTLSILGGWAGTLLYARVLQPVDLAREAAARRGR